MSDKVITRGFSIPSSLLERIEREAEKQGRSASNLVSRAVSDYLDRLDADEVIHAAARAAKQPKAA